jgi:glycosyltransferase involved in cell wall biosynthesis
MSRAWVIVTGDVGPSGGQDKANLALARFLASRGDDVHLVAHHVDPGLAVAPGVVVHRVPLPLGSRRAGGPRLDRAGRAVAARVGGARVVANGGSCVWPDVNWVHLVHAAWLPRSGAPPLAAAWLRLARAFDVSQEARALRAARVLVANSLRTRDDLVARLGIPAGRVRVQYLGADPATFGPVGAAERAAARERLGVGDRPVVAFVGALGHDGRKGFDTLLDAWARLARGGLEAVLLAAGGGALRRWRRHADELGLARSVRLLGATDRIPELLAASDLLVSPARYEPYGLNVQEALCRGVPALVTASAGVAERYPPALRDLLIPEADDTGDLAARIRSCLARIEVHRTAAERLGAELRAHTWERMAADLVRTIEDAA